MEAQAQLLRRLRGQQRGELGLQLQVLPGGVDEAPLPVVRRLAAKACMAVQHRQQGQADAAVGCGRADASRQLGRVGVGLAGLVVVHVVELRHRGITGLGHLDVQLAGDDLKLLWADLPDQAVHQVSPGPETVVGVAGNFRQACHGALESVRVQVGHAGQQRAGQALGVFGRSARLDAGHTAIAGDLDTHMAGPARR
ncbi:hypothetical protein D9M71_357090 [compost metagenome]